MKTILKKYMVLFAALLVLSGCRSPFELLQMKNSPAEKGSFSLVVDGVRAGRTIMPEIQETALVAYTLAFFTETIDDSAVIVNRTTSNLSEPVMLDAGTWNLLVTAYLDAERTKPAAQGSLSGVVITSSNQTTGSVTLSQITATGSGQGTFSWEIDYPSEVTNARMSITRLSGNNETPVDTWFFAGGSDPTKNVDKEDSLSLNAGYYRVVFTLFNGDNKSVGWSEILHIYDGMDSAFSHEFTSDQFLYVIYTVTFNSNSGSSVPSQPVYLNTTAVRPTNPTRSGYNFTGWYSNSGLTTLYNFSALVTGNITLYAGWQVAGQEGIYLGVIKFANTAVDIISPPVLLNSAGKTTLTNAITSNYVIADNIGTTMFYAIHKALANLTVNEFSCPAKLDSVNIITFTDGIDLQSRGISILPNMAIENMTFENNPAYGRFVSEQIENRTIAGVNVTAYSVGVPGIDVDQTNDEIFGTFQNNLVLIASPDKHYQLTAFSQVQGVFDEIARGLTVTKTTAAFTIVTNLLDPFVKVRMTFDVGGILTADAAASQRYIDGTINETGGSYTLTNITYSPGIDSDAGAGPLTGTIVQKGNDFELHFTFNNITIFDPDTGKKVPYLPPGGKNDVIRPRQWLIEPGFVNWRHNTEYEPGNASDSNVEKRSAIIYLVLDNSTSLRTDDIAQIRTAAINFVNSLYDRYYETTANSTVVTNTTEWNNAVTAIRNGGNNKEYIITVGGDIGIAGSTGNTFGTVTGVTVRLQGQGRLYLTSQGNMLRVAANQTLIINSNNLTLQGRRNGQNSATGNNNNAVLYVTGSNAKLELRNGTISGNTNAETAFSTMGGGVNIQGGGSFTMSGGTISGNTAAYSGGVCVYGSNAVFTMSGGTISGNTAQNSGGGVYVYLGRFDKAAGGIIYGNNAPNTADRNTAQGGNTNGHAVNYQTGSSSPYVYYYRDTTLGINDSISTTGSLPTASGQTSNGWTRK